VVRTSSRTSGMSRRHLPEHLATLEICFTTDEPASLDEIFARFWSHVGATGIRPLVMQ